MRPFFAITIKYLHFRVRGGKEWKNSRQRIQMEYINWSVRYVIVSGTSSWFNQNIRWRHHLIFWLDVICSIHKNTYKICTYSLDAAFSLCYCWQIHQSSLFCQMPLSASFSPHIKLFSNSRRFFWKVAKLENIGCFPCIEILIWWHLFHKNTHIHRYIDLA